MSDDLDRISLTLPSSMVNRLDGIVDEWEYASRSEAIRDSLRDFFATYEWESGDEQHHHGTIVIVHDHHVSGIADELQTVQHEMADIITSVQHIHLSHDTCMETLVVEGAGGTITELANRLRAIGGVQQVKVVVVDE
ncbi:nickel-responsive transcriptional regulator NikR [Haloarcula argentinensis]|uniref:Putative nickel-responsive regulator n=1 Tax=Haloarcula argentinensis TaxID=43776 RepID=A0A847UNF2_HALAR|nr:nickel-responsive transcriptional regulator NikR [Haloarcula argentinensis]NLV13374.1 nickel-responsive transcriptional regulator NikR [Haloarcula argentinensis]